MRLPLAGIAHNYPMHKPLTIGILREYKQPPDHRVAFLPEQLNNILSDYPQIHFAVEESPVRCVPDTEYVEAGFPPQTDMESCDILFGIKEIPPARLLPDKTYFFFSHTIKKQPQNRALLQAVLEKNITLIDYECLTDRNSNRTVAFGHYAGIVGAYNGLRAYGLRTGLFSLKAPSVCKHLAIMLPEFEKVRLPALKIAVTGTGRVGKGVREVLEGMNIRQVSPEEYLENTYTEPVFTMLRSRDYYRLSKGRPWNTETFHAEPGESESTFAPYAAITDILMAAAFWHPASPALFTKQDMRRPDFKIKVIADITCDIEGSIPSTLRASTIPDPFYDYNPLTEQLEPAFWSEQNISVMAVDNLPCELPRDASLDFGSQLMQNVLPFLTASDPENTLERATIAKAGRLMPRYEYLSDYAGQVAV